MKAMVDWVCRSPRNAVTAVLVCMSGLLFFPPVYWFGAAVVALVTLRFGAKAGLQSILLSHLTFGAAATLLWGQLGLYIAVVSMLFWFPAWAQAALLRRNNRLMTTLLLSMLAATALLVVVYAVSNPAQQWLHLVAAIDWDELAKQGFAKPTEQTLAAAAEVATMLLIGSLLLQYFIVLFVARWMQAIAVNPGGFRQEFGQLNFGTVVAFTGVLLAGAGQLLEQSLVRDIGCLMLLLYFIQGLAVFHASVTKSDWKVMFTWIFYLILFFVPILSISVVTVAGLVDNWLNFRRRLPGGVA